MQVDVDVFFLQPRQLERGSNEVGLGILMDINPMSSKILGRESESEP